MKRLLLLLVLAAIAMTAGLAYANQAAIKNEPLPTPTAVGSLNITQGGTAEEWRTYDLGGNCYTGNTGIWVRANYVIVRNFCIRDTEDFGIYVDGGYHDVIVEDFEIIHAVLNTNGGGWGSCLKTGIMTRNVTFRNGRVYQCWGEGLAFTGSQDVLVENVTIESAQAVAFYIDNSLRVTVRNNTAICRDPAWFRDGLPPAAFLMGDEKYTSLGLSYSQLGDVTIANNLSYGCNSSMYWGGFTNPKGVAGANIVDNVFYDVPAAWKNQIWIANGSRNSNIVISGNQFLSSAVLTLTPVPPTRTPTGTGTLTPSVTPSRTATPTRTPTRIPPSATMECLLFPAHRQTVCLP